MKLTLKTRVKTNGQIGEETTPAELEGNSFTVLDACYAVHTKLGDKGYEKWMKDVETAIGAGATSGISRGIPWNLSAHVEEKPLHVVELKESMETTLLLIDGKVKYDAQLLVDRYMEAQLRRGAAHIAKVLAHFATNGGADDVFDNWPILPEWDADGVISAYQENGEVTARFWDALRDRFTHHVHAVQERIEKSLTGLAEEILPKPQPVAITPATALHVVNAIREILFRECDNESNDRRRDTLTPNKERSLDQLEHIAAVLEEVGLAPVGPIPFCDCTLKN